MCDRDGRLGYAQRIGGIQRLCYMLRAITLASVVALAGRSFAQPPVPSFEVASIRLHTAPLQTIMGFNISGSRITMEGYNVPQLIMEAYGPRGYWQISLAAVKDLDAAVYFDIAARAPGDAAPTRDDVRKMLQTLLADRFKLSVHHETKDTPVYALVTSKGGPKLKESVEPGQCSVNVRPVTGGQGYAFSRCTLDDLAGMLGGGTVDRPVVDESGFTGKYDFRIVFMPAFMRRDQPDEISPFSAIQDLGLKLEPRSTPMDILVVDHVEKKPSDN